MSDDSAPLSSTSERVYLVALLLLVVWNVVTIALKLPVFQSIWLDEAITLWIADTSLPEVVARAWKYQASSPLHYILVHYLTEYVITSRSFIQLTSSLKMLHLLVTAAALVLFALANTVYWKHYANASAKRDRSAEIFLITLLFLLPLIDIQLYAISIRSYAPAMLLFSLHTLLLLSSFRSPVTLNYRRLLLAQLFFVGMFYFHYLYAAVALVNLLFVYRYRRAFLGRYAFVLALTAIFLAIGFWHMYEWQSKSSDVLSQTNMNPVQLFRIAFPFELLLALGISYGVLIICFARSSRMSSCGKRNLANTVLVFVVAPLAILLLIEFLTSFQLHKPRYYLWHLFFLATAFSTHAVSLKHAGARRLLVGSFCICFTGIGSQQEIGTEDWKQAQEIVLLSQYMNPEREATLLVYSGLRESCVDRFMLDAIDSEYLTAPFQIYPARLPTLPVPCSVTRPSHVRYLSNILQEVKEQSPHIYFVQIDDADSASHEQFNAFFLRSGWTRIETHALNKISISVYMLSTVTLRAAPTKHHEP